MSKVLLGATLPQFTDDPERFARAAKRAEEVGLDSVWVFDHLWPLSGGKERPVLEGWTSLALLASSTERMQVGTLVTRASLRHPALLGKMASTVAAIASGRLIIGIGSGDDSSKDENEAFGIPYYSEAERITHFESTVKLLRTYLHDGRVTQKDDFVTTDDLVASPQVEPPAVWLGGRADDVLSLAARFADGWNGWGGTPQRFARDAGQVLDYAGRRPVELSWGGLVVLGASDDEAQDRLGKRDPTRTIWGGPDKVAATLNEFVAAGAHHIVVTPAAPASPDFYDLLGEGVRPLLG